MAYSPLLGFIIPIVSPYCNEITWKLPKNQVFGGCPKQPGFWWGQKGSFCADLNAQPNITFKITCNKKMISCSEMGANMNISHNWIIISYLYIIQTTQEHPKTFAHGRSKMEKLWTSCVWFPSCIPRKSWSQWNWAGALWNSSTSSKLDSQLLQKPIMRMLLGEE